MEAFNGTLRRKEYFHCCINRLGAEIWLETGRSDMRSARCHFAGAKALKQASLLCCQTMNCGLTG